MSRKLLWVFGWSFVAFVSGCGGGSSSTSEETNTSPGANKGFFIDSPVSGIAYQTETQQGFTDENGQFLYAPGESVSFKLGDVVLGSTPAKSVVMPGDLAPTNSAATNIARLLITLDTDQNPENGIAVPAGARDAFVGFQPDFSVNPDAFNSSHLDSVLSGLSIESLVSASFAEEHLESSAQRFANVEQAQEIIRIISEPTVYDGISLPMGVSIEAIRKAASALWFDSAEPGLNIGWIRTWFRTWDVDSLRQQNMGTAGSIQRHDQFGGSAQLAWDLGENGMGTVTISNDDYADISGTTQISGDMTVRIEAIDYGDYQIIFEFDGLKLSAEQTDFLAEGTLTKKFGVNLIADEDLTLDMSLLEQNSNASLKLKGLDSSIIPFQSANNGAMQYTVTYAGRIYVSDHGFIDVSLTDRTAVSAQASLIDVPVWNLAGIDIHDQFDYRPAQGDIYFYDFDGDKKSVLEADSEIVRISTFDTGQIDPIETASFRNTPDFPENSPDI